MRAFIVRPFGTKNDKQGQPIDFDAVERALIAPALAWHGIEGRTTGEIAAAGNIREDMFRMLIASDLVIADVSIHNANVFYELGIRHALRPWRTIMVRCRADDTVFDLQTDRYLQYDRDRPGGSLSALVQAVAQTMAAERKDSPVYLLLPQLEAPPRAALLPVPLEFAEEVERAKAEKQAGDLELLAEEARGFEWESVGLADVGRAQFELGAWDGARVTWEAVRELEGEDDLEANTRLATVYQRLGDLVRSDQAIQRALKSGDADGWGRAELWALQGRNAKARWQPDWAGAAEKQAAALRSPWLEKAAAAYEDGFAEDRNHFYSGVNALGLRQVETELARLLPDVWPERFDDSQDPAKELEALVAAQGKLAVAVEVSLASARRRLDRTGKIDVWTDLSEADLRLLTSSRPAAVANAYRRALAGQPGFVVDAARRQLELYRQLGVRTANVEAALQAFPPAAPPAAEGQRRRVVLFTGHMIDAPGRERPRFPATGEAAAREAIRAAMAEELSHAGRGRDRHRRRRQWRRSAVPRGLRRARDRHATLPGACRPQQFIVASVQRGGPGWVERFRRACERLPRRELARTKELPGWLQGKANYDIWQRNNLWMLHNALAQGRDKVTLVALWDGEKGDGPGGTEHMVEKARGPGRQGGDPRHQTAVRLGLKRTARASAGSAPSGASQAWPAPLRPGRRRRAIGGARPRAAR